MTPAQWYERPGAMVAAGVAGLVAIGLLVFAVLQMSRHSTTPSQTGVPLTATTTSPPQSRASATPTTTSYTTLTVTQWTPPTPVITGPPSNQAPTVDTSTIETTTTTWFVYPAPTSSTR